jgi:hypothetical protein
VVAIAEPRDRLQPVDIDPAVHDRAPRRPESSSAGEYHEMQILGYRVEEAVGREIDTPFLPGVEIQPIGRGTTRAL